MLGHRARPITELPASRARCVFVAAFDAERLLQQLAPYLPEAARVFSLDAMRLPAERLTNRRVYLDPLNFATNFAFFRDTGTLHTRLVTANYWAGYGAAQSHLLARRCSTIREKSSPNGPRIAARPEP